MSCFTAHRRFCREALSTQLAETMCADEPELIIAQKLLLRELARMDDDSETKTLVDAASDPRTSPDVLPDARTALANRAQRRAPEAADARPKKKRGRL